MKNNQTKPIVSTNFDKATSEQKEKFEKRLVEAHRLLFRSVLGRFLASS
jgi:hypothetical protein